jgi:hypothetical protein
MCTVIVTTSPTGSNPCTRLIQEVLASLGLVEGLSDCRKIVVCDGFLCAAKRNVKKGRIVQEDVAAYTQYKANLGNLIESHHPAFAHTQLLQLETRHGFAFTLRRALALVETRFVLVVQHDRIVTRPFDLRRALSAFDEIASCKYICFQTRQTVGGAHQARVRSRANGSRVKFPPPLLLQADSSSTTTTTTLPTPSIAPLAFWYDSTHVAEVAHYREFVFQETMRRERGITDVDGPGTGVRLKLGDFVEDTVGHQLLDAVKTRGFASAHPEYGTYLWEDGFR